MNNIKLSTFFNGVITALMVVVAMIAISNGDYSTALYHITLAIVWNLVYANERKADYWAEHYFELLKEKAKLFSLADDAWEKAVGDNDFLITDKGSWHREKKQGKTSYKYTPDEREEK